MSPQYRAYIPVRGSSTSHSKFGTVGFQWWQLQSTWGQIWGPSWLQGCLQSLTTRDSEFPGILQSHGSGESLALGESILSWSILLEKESLRGHKFVAWAHQRECSGIFWQSCNVTWGWPYQLAHCSREEGGPLWSKYNCMPSPIYCWNSQC